MPDWSFESIYGSIGEQFANLFGASATGAGGVFGDSSQWEGRRDLSTLLAPVDPYNRSPLLTPLVRSFGAVTLLLLSGIAAGGLFVSFVAFLGLYFLLTEVFGYELTLAPLP